jgi:tRNA G18 (ribose-2'-O)-methylase SpoU
MSMNRQIALVGDGIENPANAAIMMRVAEMFGADCFFRDTKNLRGSDALKIASLRTISAANELSAYSHRIACDNLPGAREVFGFNAGQNFAAIVGNERRGLSHEFASAATEVVEIPMDSRRVNCLNVAAASAVLLYYLCGPRVGAAPIRNDPSARRPDVLFFDPRDHFEFGSALRSAAAFGWQHAFIQDSHNAWFGSDRAKRSESRAAARRGKNEIHLVPIQPTTTLNYARAVILTNDRSATPIHRANLTGGSSLLILTDQNSASGTDWNRFARQIEFVRLQIRVDSTHGHYRVPATIAMAEATRQIGVRPRAKGVPPASRRPSYEMAMPMLAGHPGELVHFAELVNY